MNIVYRKLLTCLLFGFCCVLVSGCTMSDLKSRRESAAERDERMLEMERAMIMHKAMEAASGGAE